MEETPQPSNLLGPRRRADATRFRCSVAGLLVLLALLGAPLSLPAGEGTRGADRLDRPPGAPLPSAPKARELYGKSVALLIAVRRYVGDWTPLDSTAEEAGRVRRALEELGFDVTLVTDEEQPCIEGPAPLTASVIAECIRRFVVEEAQEEDSRVLIWYAGHGATLDDEGFLVGVNAPGPEHPEFPLYALHIRDVGNLVRLARSRHVLAVFDSCFGGTIFRKRRDVRPAMSPAQMVALPVRQFLTAGGAEEEVPARSIFVEHFLDAIEGRDVDANPNRDAYLTASELGHYLSVKVQAASRAGTVPQTPQFGELADREFDRGNFVFDWPASQSTGAREGAEGALVPEARLEIERDWVPQFFKDCEVCPLLAVIPSGSFKMGDPRRQEAEARREVERVAIGVYEVTLGEWDACVTARACRRPRLEPGWNHPSHPVARVSHADALAYLVWLGETTGKTYRLPTEEEWEYAARANEETAFWFGMEMTEGRANCAGCGRDGGLGPLPVGSYYGDIGVCGTEATPLGGQNCFGLHDVHGNVWEWVQDCWVEEPRNLEAAEPGDAACEQRVIRGGSWANAAAYAQVWERRGYPVDTRSVALGFRVARELED